MKKVYYLFVAMLIMASCADKSQVEEPVDDWNGYARFLKECAVDHPLYAGAAHNDTSDVGIYVGNVTYNLCPNPDNASCLHVVYTCNEGWTMTETHMYAGLLCNMPLNKGKGSQLGDPKIGRFNHCGEYGSQGVSVVEYWVPLCSLPPYCPQNEDDELMIDFGFVIASHAVVKGPGNQVETAWAWGTDTFNDKGWGWYDKYYEPTSKAPFTVLYGTSFTTDSLKVYHLNVATGVVTDILREYVGNTAGMYDGTAYDTETDMFFFVNNYGELFANYMGDEDPSFSTGTLQGIAASGTFYDGSFYYVDPYANSIKKVNFDSNWQITGEELVDNIPMTITVNDITMDSDGAFLYIVGEVNSGNTELIKYDMIGDVYYTINSALPEGSQIAYGTDGVLYSVAPIVEGGSSLIVSSVNLETGVLDEIDEGRIIIIDDALIDVSRGASM